MEQSEDITALCAALSAFQGEVCGAPKGGKNPHLKNAYTRLEDAILATQDARERHGLSVVQFPCGETGGSVGVITQLSHKSGQWMRAAFTMPVGSGKGTTGSQQVGSALSYARRYAYLAVLGLATVDDDGEGTRGRREPAKAQPAPDSPLERAREALGAVSDAAALERWKAEHGARLPEGDKQHLAAEWYAANERIKGAA